MRVLHDRPFPVGARMKRLPVLLCLVSGAATAAQNLAPLYVAPDLVRNPAQRAAPAAATKPVGGVSAPAGATPVTGVATPRPATAPKGAAVVAGEGAPVRQLAPGETFIEARSMTGKQDVEMVAEGDVVLSRDDVTLRADRVTYRELQDEAEAEGNVRVNQGSDLEVRGPRARVLLGAQTGEFETPEYRISREGKAVPGEPAQSVSGGGRADMLYFEGENQYRLANATWSSCPAPDPDWYLKASEMKLDYDREVGEAKHTTIVFKDVPIAYVPWAHFPLADRRQSGFLAPSFGTSNKTGLDIATPYYFNLAPNYDATFTPRVMGRRGVQLGGEFRYLTESYGGTSRLEWLPEDAVTGGARAAGSIQHLQTFFPGFTGSLNLNGVSDSQYFEDLSTRLSNVSKANLVREGTLRYAADDWWSVTGRMQSYQTLSGTKPYRRLPQLLLNAARPDMPLGSTVSFAGEYTQFEHPDDDRPQGNRLILYPQVAMPITTSYFNITPKLGVHYTRYEMDQPVSPGENSFSRALPIASVDSSMVFERDVNWGGRDYIQTLEPRLFYVYVPYESQSPLKYPIFDTAYYDFNFAQIFSENIFSGGDRIANANQLTAALTSRLIDAGTGAEKMKVAVGQRYYFVDQRVLLHSTDVARTGKRADIVAAFGGEVATKTTLDTGWQYNPNDGNTERFSVDLRWQPEVAKALGVAWRYKRNPENADPDNPTGYRDLDITGQWPLGGRWYAVGRFNRSLLEHRTTEAIAGLEYNGGCWVLRTALHRFATRRSENSTTNDNAGSTTAFFVQLEFNGLTSLGSSPVSLLRRSVPGYSMINERPTLADDFE